MFLLRGVAFGVHRLRWIINGQLTLFSPTEGHWYRLETVPVVVLKSNKFLKVGKVSEKENSRTNILKKTSNWKAFFRWKIRVMHTCRLWAKYCNIISNGKFPPFLFDYRPGRKPKPKKNYTRHERMYFAVTFWFWIEINLRAAQRSRHRLCTPGRCNNLSWIILRLRNKRFSHVGNRQHERPMAQNDIRRWNELDSAWNQRSDLKVPPLSTWSSGKLRCFRCRQTVGFDRNWDRNVTVPQSTSRRQHVRSTPLGKIIKIIFRNFSFSTFYQFVCFGGVCRYRVRLRVIRRLHRPKLHEVCRARCGLAGRRSVVKILREKLRDDDFDGRQTLGLNHAEGHATGQSSVEIIVDVFPWSFSVTEGSGSTFRGPILGSDPDDVIKS